MTNGQNIDSDFSFSHETHKEDLMSNGQEKKKKKKSMTNNDKCL